MPRIQKSKPMKPAPRIIEFSTDLPAESRSNHSDTEVAVDLGGNDDAASICSSCSADSPIILKRTSKLNRNRDQVGENQGNGDGGAFASLQKYLEGCDNDSDSDGGTDNDFNKTEEKEEIESAENPAHIPNMNIRVSDSNSNARFEDVEFNKVHGGFMNQKRERANDDQFQNVNINVNSYTSRKNLSFLSQFQRSKKKKMENAKRVKKNKNPNQIQNQSQSTRITFEDKFESRLPMLHKRRRTAPTNANVYKPQSQTIIPHENCSTPNWGNRLSSSQPRSSHLRTPTMTQSTNTPRSMIRRTPKPEQQLSRAQQLAAATKSSSNLLHRKTPSNTKKRISSSGACSLLTDESLQSTMWPKFDKRSGKGNKLEVKYDEGSDNSISKGNGGEPSFGPSFLNNKKRKWPTLDALEEDDNASTTTDANADNDHPPHEQPYHYTDMKKDTIFATPRPSRHGDINAKGKSPKSGETSSGAFRSHSNSPQRRRKKNGLFSRILNSTRGSIEADWVKFGTYPSRPQAGGKRDFNDPRNLAKSFMDVTIVGQPIETCADDKPSLFQTPACGWSSMYINHPDKVVIKGLVHSFELNKTTNMNASGAMRRRNYSHHTISPCTTENTGILSNQNQTSLEMSDTYTLKGFEKTPTYAWLCFTRETFSELSISDRHHLRIYNARKIDLHSISDKGEYTYPFVVCTRLCEVHSN